MTFFNKRSTLVAALMATSIAALPRNFPRDGQLGAIVASGTAPTGTGTALTPTGTASASGTSPSGLVSSATESSQYTVYAGSGSAQDGWPTASQWTSFDAMWSSALNTLKTSCANADPPQPNNSQEEIQDLKDAINSQASATKVDSRFILATVMQESNGCVRVKTTVSPDGTVVNPGLMQDHAGDHTCNDGKTVQNPCPKDQIQGMIADGVSGTSAGPGLSQLLGQAPDKGDQGQQTYEAARLYNSGSIDPSGTLEKGVATHCYSSDIANRLMGWDGQNRLCPFDGQVSQKVKYRRAAEAGNWESSPAQGPSPVVRRTSSGPESFPGEYSLYRST
ncbi:MAG: hypothetical protein Q9160_005069 [Pyrenula sp. 1 TL-2023]